MFLKLSHLFQNILSFSFSLSHTNIIFTTKICDKCPCSIRCHDSNPQPLEHESAPITTRPGYFDFDDFDFVTILD